MVRREGADVVELVAVAGAGAGEGGLAVAAVVEGLPVRAKVAERRRFRPSSIRP